MRRWIILVAVLSLSGCDLPKDPANTLRRVEQGIMRVGVADNPPWTRLGKGQPTGVEAELLRQFARELKAEIRWFSGSESVLLEALEKRELDVVIAGLTETTPWKQRLGVTDAYVDTPLVIGVPLDAPVPKEAEGVSVAVEPGRPDAAYVREAGAMPVYVKNLATTGGLIAAEPYRLQAWGYLPSEIVLHPQKHVMVVPSGENAWLVRLERFLLGRRQQVHEMLRKEIAE